jgi:two-component system KDP operon response regulator KdpE
MSPKSFAILIAAVEPALRQLIKSTLLATGFQLEEASTVQSALDMTSQRRFDLVLLDLNALDNGGADACRRLRAQSPSIGIIVVGASGTEEDEWRALEAGADDCVVAPFRYREIVARMSAVLRRPPAARTKLRSPLRVGGIELDLNTRLVRRDGKDIHLSPREFDLLAVLMANKGAALTHNKLTRNAWGDSVPHTREYLRTYIQSLRLKLEKDPAHPQYILTHPWVGYRLYDPSHNKTN